MGFSYSRHLSTSTLSGILLTLAACGGEPTPGNDTSTTLDVSAKPSFSFSSGMPGTQVARLGTHASPRILLVTKNEDGDSLHVLAEDQQGALNIENSYDLGFPVSRLHTFDLDDDGLNDAVFLSPQSVYVRLATDETHFTPTSLQISLADVKAMDIGYFDSNKTGDLALLTNQYVHILTSDDTGKFTPGDVYSTSAAGVRAGDFNQDGITDLILHEGRILQTLLGNGYGSFSLQQSSPTDIPGTDDIHLGDVNNDGWPDVLLVSPTGSGGGNLNVLVNNQDGSFQSLLHLAYQNALDVDMFYTDQAVFFDADCDSMDDLAVLEFGSQTIKVLLSNGDSFAKAVTITEPYTGSFPSIDLFGAPDRNDLLITATARVNEKTMELTTYSNPDC